METGKATIPGWVRFMERKFVRPLRGVLFVPEWEKDLVRSLRGLKALRNLNEYSWDLERVLIMSLARTLTYWDCLALVYRTWCLGEYERPYPVGFGKSKEKLLTEAFRIRTADGKRLTGLLSQDLKRILLYKTRTLGWGNETVLVFENDIVVL